MSHETEQADSVVFDEATVRALETLFDTARQAPVEPSPRTGHADGLLVGEVTDTHHPDRPGLVRIGWLSAQGERNERWLQYACAAQPRKGDRVLIEQPANWPERLVVGIIADRPVERETVSQGADAAHVLKLRMDERVRIEDAYGNALIEVLGSHHGPVVRLVSRDVNLEAAGTLRLSAQALELQGGRGGVDIRTEADAVVRGRYIRLN